VPRGREDTERLTADVIELARQYGRYGYRKIAALLRRAGWSVSDRRVARIWKREGLKVPHKQLKRGRLWLTDGSCIRLRPERPNHVWSYDFIEDRTHEGRRFRMLNVIDKFTHECLAIRINRKLKAIDVIDVLSDLFILRGIPGWAKMTPMTPCQTRTASRRPTRSSSTAGLAIRCRSGGSPRSGCTRLAGLNAQFKLYLDTKHDFTAPMWRDVEGVFREALAPSR